MKSESLGLRGDVVIVSAGLDAEGDSEEDVTDSKRCRRIRQDEVMLLPWGGVFDASAPLPFSLFHLSAKGQQRSFSAMGTLRPQALNNRRAIIPDAVHYQDSARIESGYLSTIERIERMMQTRS